MMAGELYFNEIDPFAAAWLRNLWPEASIDEKDIALVRPVDVLPNLRCHFFGGIGGWEYALQLAGWPGDRPVWTGSCPCQPFSNAGKRQGSADSRHLWPEFLRLIAECRPPTIFGEQVSSNLGREWFAGVCLDLEALGYVVGAADLPACSVGSPQIRRRIFWVGHAQDGGLAGRSGGPGDAEEELSAPERAGGDAGFWSDFDVIPCRDGKSRRVESGSCPLAPGIPRGVGRGQSGLRRVAARNRVGRLRGYGNSIVPEPAAVFIRAFLDMEESLA
jgi:DNA (cytosine-5)-methyltransferase 1